MATFDDFVGYLLGRRGTILSLTNNEHDNDFSDLMLSKLVKFNNYIIDTCLAFGVYYVESSAQYRKVLGYFSLMNKFKSLKQDETNRTNRKGDDNYNENTNSNPSDDIKTPIRVYFIYMLFFYAALKSLISVYILLSIRHELRDWNPKVKVGAKIRSEKCAIKEDIYEENIDIKKHIHKYYSLTRFLGSPFSSENTNIIYLVTVISVSNLVLCLVSLTNQGTEFKLDLLSFLKNPNNEQDRIRIRIDEIIERIITDPLMSLQHNAYSFQDWLIGDSYQVFNIDKSNSNCLCAFKNRRLKQIYTDDLNCSDIGSFVRPSWLTKVAYKSVSYIILLSIVSVFFPHLLLVFHGLVGGINRELEIRFDQYVEQVKCETWNKNGTLIKDTTFVNILEPLLESSTSFRKNLINYLRDDNNHNDIINTNNQLRSELYSQILSLSGFLRLRAKLSIFAYLIFDFITYSWFQFYIILANAILFMRSLWSHQIQNQLITCVKLMNKAREDCSNVSYLNMNKSNNYNIDNIYNKKEREFEEKRKELDRSLTVVYINFELFRQDNRDFLRILRFVTGSSLLINADIIYTCYFVYKDEANLYVIKYVLGFCCFYLNLHFMACAGLTNSARQIYSLINTISGKAFQTYMDSSCSIYLWRRQMLVDEDVENIYAIHYFGIKLTQANLVSMNSYIIAAGLYILHINM